MFKIIVFAMIKISWAPDNDRSRSPYDDDNAVLVVGPPSPPGGNSPSGLLSHPNFSPAVSPTRVPSTDHLFLPARTPSSSSERWTFRLNYYYVIANFLINTAILLVHRCLLVLVVLVSLLMT